jgi:hypothetical protein
MSWRWVREGYNLEVYLDDKTGEGAALVQTIRVSARTLDWPDRCACCMGPAQTSLRITCFRTTGVREQTRRTEARSWHVPYCRRCADHQDELDRLRRTRFRDPVTSAVQLSVLIVLLVSGCLTCMSCVGTAQFGVPVLTLLLTAFVALLAVGASGSLCWFALIRPAYGQPSAAEQRRQAEERLDELLSRSCACEGPAVEYKRWSGTVAELDFASRAYADLFRQANRRKLLADTEQLPDDYEFRGGSDR